MHGGDDFALVSHVAFHGEVALPLLRLQIEDRNARARIAQLRCGRRADAARAAGDEGDGSVQFHAVTLTSRRVD